MSPNSTPNPTQNPQVLQIGFTCRNAAAASQFYNHYLGFETGSSFALQGGAYATLLGIPGAALKVQRLQLGQECLELLEVVDPGPGHRAARAIPADSRSCDLWFQHICLVSRDLDAALQRLQPALAGGEATPVSKAAQTLPEWNTAASGIRAYKFRDPDGHNLELLQFPADKGDPRWHQPSAMKATTLLGIDHSAISVASTERSCRFYDGLLGLQLGGDGVNSGPTQDDLDGLSDTKVRITSHRCSSGAGVECLNYLAPNLGRAMPADLSATDLAHWQIRLQVDNLDILVDQLEAFGGQWLSNGIVDTADQAQVLGFSRAAMVLDPDGHRLQLVQA